MPLLVPGQSSFLPQQQNLTYSVSWSGAVMFVQAEQKMLAAGYNKEYLPIEGLDSFRKATVQLLLGADHPAIKDNKVAVVQVR